MKKTIVTLIVMLSMLPLIANAYEQLADGVYQDGSTLYIGSGVTSLGGLQVNPSVIYCYATIPPACVANTFSGYGATLHVPTAAMVNYFSAQYWYYFNNVMADAVEPTSLTLSHESVTIVIGDQLHISAIVTPTNSTPNAVSWHSTNTSVATVSGGTVTTAAPGECDIIANCATLQAVCHVSVTSTQVTITLDKHEAKVLPNHMLTLTATCSPMPTELSVMSSDNTIAMPRLINGSIQVLGLKEGTATITVGSVDGTVNTDACVVTVYTEIGDSNRDGYVNISDVTSLIDYLLSDDNNSISLTNADCNKDSEVNIADVTTLIDYLLSGLWPWSHPHDADWVDLGLPSGTLWATMNVGASSPEDYGNYYAWGETEPKEIYNWSNYKWCDGSRTTLTKYCTNSSYGMVDNKTELELDDDAAYVNWGPSWRMPSVEQIQELRTHCTSVWTQKNGVDGRLVTGPNGNTLFLPATGAINNSDNSSSWNDYWSRTLIDSNPDVAYGLYFSSSFLIWSSDFHRFYGFCIRAVRISQN
ncbi:MAG: Ig-like domain-containing protein [Muribaculaceae bacterium]|nr:Ig-like domain-containing protein [Muribaculaceae bacterium]